MAPSIARVTAMSWSETCGWAKYPLGDRSMAQIHQTCMTFSLIVDDHYQLTLIIDQIKWMPLWFNVYCIFVTFVLIYTYTCTGESHAGSVDNQQKDCFCLSQHFSLSVS